MADRNGMVQMKATTFFTRNSPTSGGVLHGDTREKADVVARFPYVTAADAEYLESEKLAKRYDGRLPDETGGDGSGLTIGERSGVMVEHNADAEDSVDQPTGLSTRDTTAFERPIEQIAGAGGTRQMVVGDIADGTHAGADEAPAGGGRSRSSRSGSTGSGDGGDGGDKALSKMTTAELDAAAGDAKIADTEEYKAAKNNSERADLIEKARAASQQ